MIVMPVDGFGIIGSGILAALAGFLMAVSGIVLLGVIALILGIVFFIIGLGTLASSGNAEQNRGY